MEQWVIALTSIVASSGFYSKPVNNQTSSSISFLFSDDLSSPSWLRVAVSLPFFRQEYCLLPCRLASYKVAGIHSDPSWRP